MKILKILNGDDHGGVYTCECQFINYWLSEGVKVDAIIVGTGASLNTYKQIVDRYYTINDLDNPYEGKRLNKIKKLATISARSNLLLKSIAINQDYDVIIYRRPHFLHLAGQLKKEMNIPAYWHMPNTINNILGKVYFNVLLRKYGVTPVGNSYFTCSTLSRSVCKEVVYPGFDQKRIQNPGADMREDLNIPPDAIVLGSASRISYPKAQDILVEGLISSGVLNDKNVYCIIAGGPLDSPYAKSVVALSEDYEEQIQFLGPINDMGRFYATLDVYINSRRDPEPFGISIVEAMGFGLPVISYYLGGPSESIKDGENGWLIKNATVESYSRILKKAIEEKEQFELMGEKSKILSEKFKYEKQAELFLKIIKD